MTIPEEQKIKLESMQIKGIRWMIWNNIEKELIESRLLQIKGQSTTSDLTKLVNSQSRATLIQLIERSPEITVSIIDSAYEKYRYGLKPGFTLFWAKRKSKKTVPQQELANKIQEYLSTLHYDNDGKYKNLEYCSTVKFGDIYEISLSYLQRFNYINADGEFTFIYMMKECFVWVGINKNFIAMNNIPEVLMNSLKKFFSRLYSADITNIKITNKLLEKVFSSDHAKRVTKHNSNPPENQLEKITVADSRLSEKLSCIPAGYEDYDVTNTQYIEEIDGTTTGTLGVNCNKGKLYLSKSLTSSQFRTWSTRRINDIIGYFQNSTDVTLEAVTGFNMFTSSKWDGLKTSAIPILNEIAYAILNCKKSGIEVYPISFDVFQTYVDLSKFFIGKVSFICETCDESAIPCCHKCGSSLFSITRKQPGRVICCNCGESQQGSFSFACENGHVSGFNDINEVIELISTDDFCDNLFETIHLYFPDINFSHNEYITISSAGITIQHSPDYEKIKPSEISEFKIIYERNLIKSVDDLEAIYKTLKEKCLHPTKDKCANCKETACKSTNDIGCILKLFEGFEGFVPQPHQGHEFGDVSMLVKYQGKNMTFQGVVKSIPSGKTSSKITKSSDLGREIIQQTLSAFHDDRVDIIGVIYPNLIDDQLKYFLYHYAKLSNRRLVILDRDFMLKLLDWYIERKGL